MFVHYFTIHTLQSSAKTIEIIYKEFGENIPIYLQYEYGNCVCHAFCVDIGIDVVEICQKHNCPVGGPLFEIEIDDKIYNNSYKVSRYKHDKLGANFFLKRV